MCAHLEALVYIIFVVSSPSDLMVVTPGVSEGTLLSTHIPSVSVDKETSATFYAIYYLCPDGIIRRYAIGGRGIF